MTKSVHKIEAKKLCAALLICLLYTCNVLAGNLDSIEVKLRKCGFNIQSLRHDKVSLQTSIQVDSTNHRKISLIPIDLRTIYTPNQVDSLICSRNADVKILNNQRVLEKFGMLYSYIIANPFGEPFSIQYVIVRICGISYLIAFKSILGENTGWFEKIECLATNL